MKPRLLSALLLTLFAPMSLLRAEFVFVSESRDQKIASFHLDGETGALQRVSEVDAGGAVGCLALSRDRTRLYASVRSLPGFATFQIDAETGKLTHLATAAAPAGSAYIYPDRTNRWLLSASYSTGEVSVSPIRDLVVAEPASQVIPTDLRAHCIQTSPGNDFALVPHTNDFNRVDQFRFDAETGRLEKNGFTRGAPGAGPRHLQFHPNGRWVYLVNEQGKSVTHCLFDEKAGTLSLRKTLSTLPEEHRDKGGSCADIEISRDGRFLYASNRGHNSIAIFAIDPDEGSLTSLGQEPTEEIPRSFNLIPQKENFLVAAGQKSNTLAVYRREAKSGLLTLLKVYPCGESPAWVQGL